ncbi:hypothetical protein [Flindersiella endophytica]
MSTGRLISYASETKQAENFGQATAGEQCVEAIELPAGERVRQCRRAQFAWFVVVRDDQSKGTIRAR